MGGDESSLSNFFRGEVREGKSDCSIMVSQSRKEFLVDCVDWKKIKAEYIAGGTSYRKLAQKHGVSFNTLKTRARDEEWYNLRQQKDNRTTTKIVESLSDKDAEKAVNIIDVADKLLTKISELMDDLIIDTQSMKHLTSALKDLKEIKGFKSDADMREQNARIKNLERQAEADSADDREITVVIEGDLANYTK